SPESARSASARSSPRTAPSPAPGSASSAPAGTPTPPTTQPPTRPRPTPRATDLDLGDSYGQQQKPGGELGIEVRRLLRHRLAALGVLEDLADARRAHEEGELRHVVVDGPDGLLRVRRELDALRLVLLNVAHVELVVGLEPEEVPRSVHRERFGVP